MTDMLPYTDRLLARRPRDDGREPFFCIAIPQYGRRRYIEVGLASIFAQTSRDFEIVVSDDYSKDDSNAVLPGVLEASGTPFRYYAQPKNLGYDGNVRFLLHVSRARYVILLGNDDALAAPDTLSRLEAALRQLDFPKVAFANAQSYRTGELQRRAFATRVIGSGPATAVDVFRSFSFVSGLIFDCEWAHRYETDRWDRSVFYQIYLATKIIACGGTVAAINVAAIRQQLTVDGQIARGVASRLAEARWTFASRHSGMDNVIRVAADAVLPSVPEAERSAWARRIVGQILGITYPYWLVEYRSLGNWSTGVGLARGMWPPLYTKDIADLNTRDQLLLWGMYFGVTGIGLTVPAAAFRKWAPTLARAIRRRAQGERDES